MPHVVNAQSFLQCYGNFLIMDYDGLLSFPFDNCGYRGWYDSLQSALRPSYQRPAHCACPDMCFSDCVVHINGVLLCPADRAGVLCVIKTLYH